jgi:hypothetical protein
VQSCTVVPAPCDLQMCPVAKHSRVVAGVVATNAVVAADAGALEKHLAPAVGLGLGDSWLHVSCASLCALARTSLQTMWEAPTAVYGREP